MPYLSVSSPRRDTRYASVDDCFESLITSPCVISQPHPSASALSISGSLAVPYCSDSLIQFCQFHFFRCSLQFVPEVASVVGQPCFQRIDMRLKRIQFPPKFRHFLLQRSWPYHPLSLTTESQAPRRSGAAEDHVAADSPLSEKD